MPDQPTTDLPDQPDGIEDDSRDLPNPTTAAERVDQYIRATGDGLYDVQDRAPLYARDLEAVTRAALAQDATRAERDQLRYERRLLGTCRVFLDGLAKTAQSVNLQRAAADLAQRIVDEIGHPVTDEPALGPELRAELARVTAERTQWLAEIANLVNLIAPYDDEAVISIGLIRTALRDGPAPVRLDLPLDPKLSQPINPFDIPGSPDAYACRRPVYIGDVGYAEPCGRELPCPEHPAPVPGSSRRAPEPTDVTIRGVRVCLPDERRCADPDRPVRIVVAGVAYADLNAGEAQQIAAALVAAAGESQASEPQAPSRHPDGITDIVITSLRGEHWVTCQCGELDATRLWPVDVAALVTDHLTGCRLVRAAVDEDLRGGSVPAERLATTADDDDESLAWLRGLTARHGAPVVVASPTSTTWAWGDRGVRGVMITWADTFGEVRAYQPGRYAQLWLEHEPAPADISAVIALAGLYDRPAPKLATGGTADPYTAETMLCDGDGIVRKGVMHHGTDYPCTGHAHFAGEHIRCTSPAHAAPKLAQGGIIRPVDLVDRAASPAQPARSTRFQDAVHGPRDWLSFRAGSGRQHSGERSDKCPGDGIPDHRHDIGCIRPPSPPKPPTGRPQTFA